MIMKNFIIILFIFLIIINYSCNNFLGKYVSGTSALKLNKDGSFDFFDNHGLYQFKSNGKFKKINNRIFILNSNIDISNLPIEVIELNNNSLKKDQKEFVLMDKNEYSNNLISKIKITINDTIEFYFNYNTKEKILSYSDTIKKFTLTCYINNLDYTIFLNRSIKYKCYDVLNFDKNKFLINIDNNASLFNYLSLTQDSIFFDSKRCLKIKRLNQVLYK